MIKAGLNSVGALDSHASLVLRLANYFVQPFVVAGLAVYGLGTAMWIFAVSKRDISYLFPLTALNYVLVMLGGEILFVEQVPFKRWAGVALVIVGVAVMQNSSRKGSR